MDLIAVFPFLRWFKLVTKQSLKADFIAGLTGAVIVLPQGVAFATIAGLPPEYGLYTAMITPIVAALFGSSLHLISGPTTAISIVIFSSISHHADPGTPEFISLALTITFLAGVYQLVFGLARLGKLVNFVSHTVVIGFTAGAAILIATSQMKNVLGLALPKGDTFFHTWVVIWHQFSETNLYVLTIALCTLLTALVLKKKFPNLPDLLIGMVVGSILAYWMALSGHPVPLVGEIPAHLPPPSIPDFSYASIKMLAPEAFAVALLGLIEAVSISRSISNKSNQRIDANQEFIGQGLSNIAGSFFSSYAGSGSFTRSGVNYAAGAKTPLSAIFAAFILMVIILSIAPLTAYLPVAAMGGVILIVAYKLIDFHRIREIIKNSKSESAIFLTTFLATLLLELEFAIYLGVLLSLVVFLARTATPEIVTLSIDRDTGSEKRKLVNISNKPVNQCPQLKIIRIDMSVYFGSLDYIQNRIDQITEKERIVHILIVATGINLIDLSGEEMLLTSANRLKQLGGGLYFSELKERVYEAISRHGFVKKVGNQYFFDRKKEAIASIYRRLNQDLCDKCEVHIFNECE
ncbi:MAG: SulP family inorganic anion transporter [Chromatiaceae bacterium]|nr:SulP family inorganic anion transporter [Chromatiaceae bacterium]MCP5443823.1 SulP family inorganic anion transporter [Chromatiaceae bacterium]